MYLNGDRMLWYCPLWPFFALLLLDLFVFLSPMVLPYIIFLHAVFVLFVIFKDWFWPAAKAASMTRLFFIHIYTLDHLKLSSAVFSEVLLSLNAWCFAVLSPSALVRPLCKNRIKNWWHTTITILTWMEWVLCFRRVTNISVKVIINEL